MTHEFLGSGALWTAGLEKATPVADYMEAACLAKTIGLQRAELYYSFKQAFHSDRWDFSIPLDSSFAEPLA